MDYPDHGLNILIGQLAFVDFCSNIYFTYKISAITYMFMKNI